MSQIERKRLDEAQKEYKESRLATAMSPAWICRSISSNRPASKITTMDAMASFELGTKTPNRRKHWPEVAIIVAASQSMGMSYLTHLPWPKLKREHKHINRNKHLDSHFTPHLPSRSQPIYVDVSCIPHLLRDIRYCDTTFGLPTGRQTTWSPSLAAYCIVSLPARLLSHTVHVEDPSSNHNLALDMRSRTSCGESALRHFCISVLEDPALRLG